jgi:AmmeMemoRadiSam system protein A
MLNEAHKKTLHRVARQSIEHGLATGRAPNIKASGYDQALREKRATFVTLKIEDKLRGCIGTLTALRPLVEDVAHNAFAAAFEDTRFEPLSNNELEQLSISISVLDTPEEMLFDSEQDVIRQLRPGEDGIILQENARRATFLPSVWESVENKVEFLQHLKLKAGLPKNYWSDDVRILRYTVEYF